MFDNIDDLITKDKKEFKEKKSLVGRPKKHDFEKKEVHPNLLLFQVLQFFYSNKVLQILSD